MFWFKPRPYYFSLYFKEPKNTELKIVVTCYDDNRLGINRINNVKAGEEISAEAQLVNVIHHGRMTKAQWEREI